MGYIHASQSDLAFRFSLDEDLTGYAAVMYYYKQDDGNSTRATVTCTVTATSTISYCQYIQSTTPGAILTTYDADYILYLGLTASTTLTRSSSPVAVHVNEEGNIEYSQ